MSKIKQQKQDLIDSYNKNKEKIGWLKDEQYHIRDEFLKFAKFKIGNKIKWSQWSTKSEELQGFISYIYPVSEHGNKIGIHYQIKKIKKNGEVSKHNHWHSPVAEDELELIG